MPVEHSQSDLAAAAVKATGVPRLAIDATGVMLWPPGKGLAGIPRVESFLVNAALADLTTLSSVSLNLLPMPLTCMWSAPASRQILCQAV